MHLGWPYKLPSKLLKGGYVGDYIGEEWLLRGILGV